MANDLKMFIGYIFSIKGFLKGTWEEIKELFHPKRFFVILLILALVSLIFVEVPYNRISAIILLVFALLVQLRWIHKSGDHIKWYKDKVKENAMKKIEKEAKENGEEINKEIGEERIK